MTSIQKSYLFGILAVISSFSLGWFSHNEARINDLRLRELQNMSLELTRIADHLSEQKIIEKEKIVQAPFCEWAEKERLASINRNAKKKVEAVTDLQVCKQLMYFSGKYPDIETTYDAIGKWIETSKAVGGGIEDTIMMRVLSTLIYCFKNT